MAPLATVPGGGRLLATVPKIVAPSGPDSGSVGSMVWLRGDPPGVPSIRSNSRPSAGERPSRDKPMGWGGGDASKIITDPIFESSLPNRVEEAFLLSAAGVPYRMMVRNER